MNTPAPTFPAADSQLRTDELQLRTAEAHKAAATDHLRRFGVNVTRPRVAIMEYLMTHRTHPSVDTIFADLADEMPGLSRTTVYNTVNKLAQHGAVTLLSIDDHNINVDGNTFPHAHLHCTSCGRIIDIPLQGISPLQASHPFSMEGHLVQEVHQYYRGVCRECQEAVMPRNLF